MDDLRNKTFITTDYTSRYTHVPLYYNQRDKKQIFGIGQNMSKNIPWVAHKVKTTDNLDKLALAYYNNPTYWWVIAYFNDIPDSFIKLSDYYDIIKVPALESINFEELR